MRKLKLPVIVAFILIPVIANSQNSLQVNRNQINVGVGLSGWGVPVYFGIDHGVHKNITIGGEISYRSYKENWKEIYYRHNIWGISGNANYHLNNLLQLPSKWDLYAGFNLGFYIWSSPETYSGTNSSGLGLGLQLGGRYFLSKNVGINIEVGSGNAFSDGKIGLTFKL